MHWHHPIMRFILPEQATPADLAALLPAEAPPEIVNAAAAATGKA
jgi:hypothetical protein